MKIIDAAEASVSEKSFFNLREIISENYQDRSGLNRRSIMHLAGFYFRSQDKVRIVRLSSGVEMEGEDSAKVTLRVQVFGESGGSWARGLTDDSAFGEVFIIGMANEGGSWKIRSIDPEKRNWPTDIPMFGPPGGFHRHDR